ncbi:MAG TPA: glutamate racemase [Candidatus Saccharimonadales bacterium]|jgi:glutamate racemase|nr:glutamate racemase [Candidatus Saccharimonadales bacterium]
MKIGVFDSGVGGLSVANAIQAALPEHEIILREDRAHLPYGTRPPQELLQLVVPIFQEMVDTGCQVIVVACNTVSTTLIDSLRQRFEVPLVAIEPMVKPASELTKSRIIAVCATPTTLASIRYTRLKDMYAKNIKVLEPDCADWAVMIEHNQIDDQKVISRMTEVLDAGADVVVLACTHYHWIEDKINELAAGRAQVLQPETAIIRQLKQVLARLA